MLYVMLFGMYPFEDPNDQRNYAKTITVRLPYAVCSSLPYNPFLRRGEGRGGSLALFEYL